ncbi:hypothetical protein QJS10_CPB11g01833 [Acorus calamus]|uniref:Glutathione S-transferase n=1 Tax=Acorus calamus TaxID=4465 RepID=A0AAV9DV81_ACOCL|nr:hypothetical protein QJS10_CPB11g01833 [Acorus calamus]
MEGVKLLDFWVSLFGLRVRIALAEKGVEHEYKEEDLWEKSELLVGSNPVYKKIPVLIHDGRPGPIRARLCFPKDPYLRARARLWADFVDKKIFGCGERIVKAKGEDKERAKEEMISNMKLLEEALEDEPFFGGEAFRYVDISLISFASWFHAFEVEGSFSIMDACPRILEWVKRCKGRECVSKALPDPGATVEFVGVLKKQLGIE